MPTFDEDKHMYVAGAAIANVDASTVDGTYSAEEAAVIADLRTKLNSVLAALRAANIIALD